MEMIKWCEKCRCMNRLYREKFKARESNVFRCAKCDSKIMIKKKWLRNLFTGRVHYEIRD